jgi:hypothetical protein
MNKGSSLAEINWCSAALFRLRLSVGSN